MNDLRIKCDILFRHNVMAWFYLVIIFSQFRKRSNYINELTN